MSPTEIRESRENATNRKVCSFTVLQQQLVEFEILFFNSFDKVFALVIGVTSATS